MIIPTLDKERRGTDNQRTAQCSQVVSEAITCVLKRIKNYLVSRINYLANLCMYDVFHCDCCSCKN